VYSPTYGVRTLSLHEGEPGHHFQVECCFIIVVWSSAQQRLWGEGSVRVTI